MSESFDPYRKWLGIPPQEQPPHHYRLLGIGVFETDVEVIQESADRQMSHLQTHKTGKYSDLSQKLLNEIAQAKICLLNDDKKSAYDAQLKAKLAAGSQPQVAQPARPATAAVVNPAQLQPGNGMSGSGPIPQSAAMPLPAGQPQRRKKAPLVVEERGVSQNYRSRRRNDSQMLIIGGVVVAALLVVGFFVLQSSSGTSDVAQGSTQDPAATNANTKTPPDTTDPEIPPPPQPDVPIPPPPVDPATPKPPVDPNPATGNDPGTTPNPPNGTDPTGTNEPNDPQTPDTSPTDPPATTNDPPATAGPLANAVRRRAPFEGRADLAPLATTLENAHLTEIPIRIQPAREKHPVPEQAAQDDARKVVREVFADDFKAATTPEFQTALAWKLYSQAAETRDDRAAQYVLLQQARDLAIEAGDAIAAFKVAEGLANVFQVDPLEVKSQALTECRQTAGSPPAHKSVATCALVLAEQAVLADDFTRSDKLIELGLEAARDAREQELIRLAVTMQEESAKLQTRQQDFQRALASLQDSPDDPQANYVAGRYCALVLGDWDAAALPLSKGQDAGFRAAAGSELSRPEEPNEQAAVGDNWWDLADKQEDEFAQRALKERAEFWYRRSVGQLAGLNKIKVEKRLTELSSLATAAVVERPVEPDPSLAKFAERFIGQFVLTSMDIRTKQTSMSIIEFHPDFKVTEGATELGYWEVDGTRIKMTFPDPNDQPVYLVPKSVRDVVTVTTRRTTGKDSFKWDLVQLKVVMVWDHKYRAPSRFGRGDNDNNDGDGDGERTERLTFYSNGRVNDPMGNFTWSLQGRTLKMDWGEDGRQTTATIDASGRTYSGQSQRRFFGFNRRYPVAGVLVSTEKDT